MQSLQKIRGYEFILVFISITIYVIRRLLEVDYTFTGIEFTINESHSSKSITWINKGEYNYLLNTALPIISGGIFFFLSWYIFHYLVYQRVKEQKYDQKLYLFIISSVIFAFISVFLFSYFKLYFTFRNDTLEI